MALLVLYGGASELAARHLTAPRTGLSRPRSLSEAPPSSFVTADGLRLASLRVDPPASPARGTVVLAHGVGNDRRLLVDTVGPALKDRGYRLFAFDFRAHGESEGDRTTLGSAEARDVAEALQQARQFGGPVGFVGFSMGAVAYLLSGSEADAAVLDSPYASLRGALSSRLGRAGLISPLSAGVLARVSARLPTPLDTVRPAGRVAHLTRPTLFLFAEFDQWVPREAREAYTREGTVCVSCEQELLPGETHGGHFSTAWAQRVASFLDAKLDP
ncbi:alpha/beta hydrolase [Chondromyces crocatus]|uniref:Serine aminopeptidase S33 domain-containing protein n=1 Tax=Chondromyces crocatus TaxID=52 RepID=A0A0K1EQD7_CHOCO|nr:alpha/beta fold hydrolase [Chondromyces crocatus]AKT42838.1 uncharacterized protein CMC5_070660 [Chondromyces crocatus]